MRMKAGLIAGAALLAATALWAQQAMVPPGYLAKGDVVDAARYIPPPPADNSPAGKADRAAIDAAKAHTDPAVWKAAVAELHMRSPEARVRMLCAIDANLTPENAPAFYRLMLRAGIDLAAASDQSKNVWKRPRPFTTDKNPETCYPADELAKGLSWSYPSGHSATGWIWGMIMSEVAPDRTAEALAWGAAVGDHRIACRVHYPSDVMAGRMLGSAVFARLAARPDFRADVDAAKAEVAALRAKGEHAVGCAS